MTTTERYHSQHASLDVPEDSMEMVTSPYHHADDLDFDVDVENEQLAADDNMHEINTADYDAMQQEEAEHYEDDEMADQEQSYHVNVEDEQELLDWQEDDLTNYAEGEEPSLLENRDDFTEHSISNTAIKQDGLNVRAGQDSQTNQESDEQEDMFREEEHEHTATDGRHDETSAGSHVVPGVHAFHEEADRAAQQHASDTASLTMEPTDSAPPDSSHEAHGTLGDQASTLTLERSREGPDHSEESVLAAQHNEAQDNAGDDDPLLNEDAEVKANGDTETKSVKSEVNLHPVQIIWGDEQYSLFRTEDAEEDTHFLLDDAKCADQSFDVLFNECRRVLGGEVPDYHDLVMDFSSLGLHVCEDSKYATQISLSQVVDAYMLLSQNEQRSVIEPMTCTLSTRPCISKQIQWLQEQADGGRPYSEVITEILADQFDGSDAEATPQALERPEDDDEAYDHNHDLVEHERPSHQEEPQVSTSIATDLEAADGSHSFGDAASPYDEVEDLFSDEGEHQEPTGPVTPSPAIDRQPDNSTAEPAGTEDLGSSTDRHAISTSAAVISAETVRTSINSSSGVADTLPIESHSVYDTSTANEDSTTKDIAGGDEEDEDDDLLDLDIDDQPGVSDAAVDNESPPSNTADISSTKRKLELDQEDFEIDLSITPVKKNRSS